MRNNLIALAGMLALCFTLLPAQVRVGSPYSRFGVGDLHRISNARLLSMGGTSIAQRDNVLINYWNPASYTSFDSLSFVFEGGITDHYATTRTADLSSSNNYISLGYLLFGFPLTSWWKASVGLLPFSDVGYNISYEEVHPEAGPLSYLFKGNGGINQFYFGSGFRITPKLSLGFNLAYLFGTLDKSRAVYFNDTAYSFNLRISNRLTYGDLLPGFGLQYHTGLPDNHFLNVGVTYGPQTNLQTSQDQLALTFTTGATGIEFIKDTISSGEEAGDVTFPGSYGLGLMYGKTDSWEAVMDARMQNWDDYRYFGIRDSLRNSFQVSGGFAWVPDPSSVSSFWERIVYRAGLRYSSTYLELRERQLSEIGISFGLGIPLRRSQSMLNLGMEFGRRGTTAEDLIQENFMRFVLGVSVHERWFVKRRYE